MWFSKRVLLTLCVFSVALVQVAYSQNKDEGINDEPLEVSIDQIIIDAANSSSEFDFLYDENATLIKVQLDMVYSVEEYNAMEIADGYANASESGRKKRTAGLIAGRGGARRWTNNQVPYQLAGGTFSVRDTNTIRAAIKDWQNHTCLSFQQRSYGNRIYMKNGGGCYSRVGMVGGAQELGLAPGCRHKGVVIHEIGHALGLHHEQTRPDRDEHVTIVRQNIPSRMYYNFQKNTWNTILNMGIPYDYTSIMHYGKTAFSVNGGLTIRTRDPAKQNVIGNRQGLSFRDIKSINIMYNCKRHSSGCTKTDAECPGEGFVDKKCQCICPGSGLRDPTRRCSGGGGGRVTTRRPTVTQRPRPTPRPTPRPSSCRDMNRNCNTWQRRGECRRSRGYMSVYCKRSCGLCGGGTTTTSTCRNRVASCPGWRWYCNHGYYRRYMQLNCKATCGLCRSGSRHRTNHGGSSASCTDNNYQCPSWASTGECRRNPDYMLTNCKLSCHQCHVSDNASSQNSNCVNRHRHCSYWHSMSQCTNPRYRSYMEHHCPQICGFC